MAESVKYFSKEDLDQHKDKNSLWVLIDDSIYDVTKFMDEHPGGEEILLEQGGLDATENFEDVGHSTDARELMKDYKIGELKMDEREEKAKYESRGHVVDDPEKESFLKTWVLPIAVALAFTVVYRLYLNSSSSSS